MPDLKAHRTIIIIIGVFFFLFTLGLIPRIVLLLKKRPVWEKLLELPANKPISKTVLNLSKRREIKNCWT